MDGYSGLDFRDTHRPDKRDHLRTALLWPSEARADFYESLPISALRAPYFPDHKFVAGIHGSYVNFLVWEDDDHSVFHIDHHLLLAIYRFACELLELLKERLSPPGRWVARIDVEGDQVALHAQEHFAFVGT